MSLSAVQMVNYLVPLVVVPLVLRVIGVERFGTVTFMQSVAMILAGLCDYGFNISATRDISINRNDIRKLSEVFTRVLSTKLFLFLVAAGLMYVLHLLFSARFGAGLMVISVLAIVLGNVLLPVWFFLGVEKMRYLTYLNTASKLVYLLLVILLVRKPEDDYLILLLFGLSTAVFALVGLWLIRRQFKVIFEVVTPGILWLELKSGRPLFLSNLSTTSIINVNTFVLGLFVQGTTLGFFGVAEKIILAMIQLLSTFSQATFPAICNLTTRDDFTVAVKDFFKKHYLPFMLFMPMITLGIVYFSAPVIQLMVGEPAPEAAFYLKILSIVPLLIMLNIPANQLLLALGHNRIYQNIFLLVALFNLILNVIGAKYYGAIGTAFAMILTHVVLTSGLYAGYRRQLRIENT
jgi:polysaccharide transporter, PST family